MGTQKSVLKIMHKFQTKFFLLQKFFIVDASENVFKPLGPEPEKFDIFYFLQKILNNYAFKIS